MTRTSASEKGGSMCPVCGGIRTRLIVVFCSLFTIIIIALKMTALFGIPGTNIKGRVARLKETAFENLSLAADLQKDAISAFLRRACGELRIAAQRNSTEEGVEEILRLIGIGGLTGTDQYGFDDLRQNQWYRNLLADLSDVIESHGYKKFMVADAGSGRIIMSTDASDLGSDVSGDEIFTRIIANRNIYIDEVRHSLDGKGSLLRAACPVKTENGRVSGVLILVIDADKALSPLLHTVGGLGKSGEALLVNYRGRILTSLKYSLPDGTTARPLEYEVQDEPARRAAKGQEGIIEADDYRGVPVLATCRYIVINPDLGWGMVVKIDRDEIFSAINEDMMLTGWLGAVAILVTICMTAIIAGHMTRPIRILADTAWRISTGQRDARTGMTGKDEIGRLAIAFDSMADTVEKTTDGLEAAVTERTNELMASNQQLRASNQQLRASEQQLQASEQQLRAAQSSELELQAKLNRSQRMESLGILAGGAAHDLNNTLGPMLVLPDMLADDFKRLVDGQPVNTEDVDRALKIIKSSAARAAATVKDLVSLSRRGEYDLVPADLNQVECVSGPCQILKDIETSNPGVAIIHKLTTEALPISADNAHLARAIGNIVRNGAESIDGEGKITLKTFRENLSEPLCGYEDVPAGDYAVVKIADTGKGIEPNHIEHIFEPFFTEKAMGEMSGSGLGLSVVYGIVRDHNGFIDVESEVDKGTTFTLYFPIAIETTEKHAVTEDTLPSGGMERILVVDDDASQRFIGRLTLKRLGYQVTDAGDGHKAVELFREAKEAGEDSPYDLIILDMLMEKDFDGLAAYEEILTLYPDQKVVICSGHAEDGRAKAAEELGADWIAKPYEMNDLARVIRQRLDR